jgi:hypothetical protein
MSFPFNMLRIFIDKHICGTPEWLFVARRFKIGDIPKDTMVVLYGPVRDKYTVSYYKDVTSTKTTKWSSTNLETAWRAAWRRLMEKEKCMVMN